MNKVKIALTLLTIAITVGPLVYVVFNYRDNLFGLVVPPQLTNLSQNAAQNVAENEPSQNSQGTPSSSLNLTDLTGSNIQMPQVIGAPQYNPDNGDFSLSVNVTNPLANTLSIDQLSAQIESKDNSGLVGNISIPQSIDLQPGANSIINVTGVISQELYNQISEQNTGNINVNSFVLTNVNVVVNGVKFHFNEIDPSSILSSGGS